MFELQMRRQQGDMGCRSERSIQRRTWQVPVKVSTCGCASAHKWPETYQKRDPCGCQRYTIHMDVSMASVGRLHTRSSFDLLQCNFWNCAEIYLSAGLRAETGCVIMTCSPVVPGGNMTIQCSVWRDTLAMRLQVRWPVKVRGR